MAQKIVSLDRNGAVPEIELKFGFAQFAKYRIFLFDQNGQNPIEVAHGINVDTSPDKFRIGNSVAALDGRFITWQAVIASPVGGPGQQFSQEATFTQQGIVRPSSPFRQSGVLNNTVTTFDQAKFVVE